MVWPKYYLLEVTFSDKKKKLLAELEQEIIIIFVSLVEIVVFVRRAGGLSVLWTEFLQV